MEYSLDNSSKIIKDLQKGKIKAFNYIFTVLFNALVRYTSGLTGNRANAEDIVQHIFLKLWENRANLTISSSIQNYLYRSCHNRFIDLYRQQQKRFLLSDTIYYQTMIEEEEKEGENLQSEKQKLNKAIQNLPPKCREVFELNKFRGLKYAEIAKKLNISVKTVENHMTKAFKLIKDEVK